MLLSFKKYPLTIFILNWVVLLVIAAVFFSTVLSYRLDFSYTTPTHFNPQLPNWAQHTLAPWANFDGIHYLQIAGNGYVDQGRFLPLYPGLIAVSSFVLDGATTFSTKQVLIAQVLSLVIFLSMIVVWLKLLTKQQSSTQAHWTLALFLAFPTSFFLISIYSESLFLLLVGLTFLLAQHKKWSWALIPAALLSVTRLTGFVMIPTLAFLFWQENKFPPLMPFIAKHWLRLLSFTLPIIPLLLYAYFNYLKWGDELYFVHAHGQLSNGRETSSIVLLPITLFRYLKIFTSLSPQLHEFRVAALELLSFLMMASLFIWSWVKKVPQHYLLFAGLALLIPTLSGTLTGFPRYSLAALPLFIVLADLPKNTKLGLISIGILLQLLLLSWFVTGYFVA